MMVNNQITYQKKTNGGDLVTPSYSAFDSGDLDLAVWIAGDIF